MESQTELNERKNREQRKADREREKLTGRCSDCNTKLKEIGSAASYCPRCAEDEEGEGQEGGFIVRCRVSGGVTGTREGILKGLDGQPESFGTLEAAQERARGLSEKMNGPYAVASFAYWAEEAEGGYR